MTNKFIILSLAISAAMLTCPTTHSTEHADMGKRILTEEHERIATISRGEAANAKLVEKEKFININVCTGTFTVNWLDEDGDPHLSIGDKFRIIGPFPWINFMMVAPIHPNLGPAHKWLGRNYAASPRPGQANWYKVRPFVEPHPDDGAPRQHDYWMRVTIWDGICPTYVKFTHGKHADEAVIGLHPGHAGASRD